MAASIREVAAQAEVSVGTVSNVLNRPHLVAEATRRKVQRAINDLGFVRNESARHLRAGHSRTIGLLVLDVGNPFFTDVCRGVEEVANKSALAVMLCNSDESTANEERYLKLLEEMRVQGVLITPVGELSPRLRRLHQRGVPVVLVDHRSIDVDLCSVGVDDIAGGELAVGHLIELGHRRIAFVTGPLGLRQCQDRLAGARQALSHAGLKPAALVVLEVPALNVAGGKLAGERLATMPNQPTAAFCANDLLALGVLQEMTRRRIGVPHDLAIVGYDDIEFAAAAAVPLTSVRQPREQLGHAAAELLLDEVRQPDDHQHRRVIFSPELLPRASTILAGDGSDAPAARSS